MSESWIVLAFILLAPFRDTTSMSFTLIKAPAALAYIARRRRATRCTSSRIVLRIRWMTVARLFGLMRLIAATNANQGIG